MKNYVVPVVKTPKKFRRVYLTIDNDVMVALDLDPDTVTAAELRKRLREVTGVAKRSNKRG